MKTLISNSLFLLVLGGLAAPALSQEVTFRGKVEDGEDVCYYCPGFGYVIDGTKTTLSSTNYALEPLVGSQIRAVGIWNGSASAPNIHITFLEVVQESFSLSGGGQLGDDLGFTANGQPGDAAIVARALGATGFLALPGLGVAFLDATSLAMVGAGPTDGSGEYSKDLAIPNLPGLQGLTIFGQGLILRPSGELYTTNPDLKTLGG